MANVTDAEFNSSPTTSFVGDNVTTSQGAIDAISEGDRKSWLTIFQLILILILLVLGKLKLFSQVLDT